MAEKRPEEDEPGVGGLWGGGDGDLFDHEHGVCRYPLNIPTILERTNFF